MEEVPVVQHDHVVLSTAEKAALAALVAAMRAEDAWLAALLDDENAPGAVVPAKRPVDNWWGTNAALLLAVAITSLLAGGLLAVVATGDVAWSAWLVWGWGTLAALCFVVTSNERRRRRPRSARMMASYN
jgi:hypothetical protein